MVFIGLTESDWRLKLAEVLYVQHPNGTKLRSAIISRQLTVGNVYWFHWVYTIEQYTIDSLQALVAYPMSRFESESNELDEHRRKQ